MRNGNAQSARSETTQTDAATSGAILDAAARSDEQAARRTRRLTRFAPIFRERIAALTCCAPQAEDLADSFPGMLVALVSDFSTREARVKAFQTVLEGGSIKDAAQLLALPLWLKKMPPEAFREPIRHLPTESQFTAKIGNFIPQKPSSTGDWLEQVSFADEACDSDFALWVAKHCGAVATSRRRFLFLLMAAWAWHANRPGTVGHELIERPWSAKMGLRRATEGLTRWRRRVDLACLIDGGIENAWLEGGTVAGFEFVPLLTVQDFMQESLAMNNCLDQYADRLSTGLIRIFSIRQGHRRIADIEVGPSAAPGATPAIVQIKGPHNRQAPLAVWQAAQQWLESQALDTLTRRPGAVRASEDCSFWGPYFEWLPIRLRAEFEACVLSNRRRVPQHLTYPLVDAAPMHMRMMHRCAPQPVRREPRSG